MNGDQVYLEIVFSHLPNMKPGRNVFTVLETKLEGKGLKKECNEEAIRANCKGCAFQPGMCFYICLGL